MTALLVGPHTPIACMHIMRWLIECSIKWKVIQHCISSTNDSSPDRNKAAGGSA